MPFSSHPRLYGGSDFSIYNETDSYLGIGTEIGVFPLIRRFSVPTCTENDSAK
jgi:hypothetical protein